MKYTHYILKMMVPEWIKLYLNFRLLKTYLSVTTSLKTLLVLAKKTKSIQEYKLIKSSIIENNILMDKMEYDNTQFIEFFKDEVEKVETFVIWKYTDLKQKMIKLKQQTKQMNQIKDDLECKYEQWRNLKSNKRTNVVDMEQGSVTLIDYNQIETDYDDFKSCKKELLETFFTFLNETVHFSSYVDVNTEGIRKILKKYKKQMIKGIRKKQNERIHFGAIVKKMKLSNVPNRLKSLLFDIEQIMVLNFYPNKPKLCRKSLRQYMQNKEIDLKTLFAFGFFTGFALIFIIIILFMRYEGYLNPNADQTNQDKTFEDVFPCLRGTALFLIYYWCLALDVWGWNYFRINYKIYLGFNHHFSSLTQILQRVSVLSSVYLLIFVVYSLQAQDIGKLTSAIEFMDPTYLPLIIWLACSFYLFIPTKRALNGEGRQWMFKIVLGSIFGHLIKYESRYTFVIEQFVSLVIPLSDLDYTICYYYQQFRYGDDKDTCQFRYRYAAMATSTGLFFIMCLHCLTCARDKGKFWNTQEMWNFFKNLIVMQLGIVALLTRYNESFVYLWGFLAIVCVSITFWWDVSQDWLLFRNNARYKFLRDDLGYNKPYVYYVLAGINFVLRCVFVISISPDILIYFGTDHQMIIFLVGTLELIRRLIFNFFKMEKEHITNQDLFKTVKDYVYPFESKMSIRKDEFQGDDAKTHWSVSTLNQVSEVEILSKWNNDNEVKARNNRSEIKLLNKSATVRKSDKQDIFQVSPSNQIRQTITIDSTSKQSPIIKARAETNLFLSGIQQRLSLDHDREEEAKQNNNQDGLENSRVTQNQFRLTYLVKKESDKEASKKTETFDLSSQTFNIEILNRAKAQEKLQIKKTNLVQEDNKKYKEVHLIQYCQIISLFYVKFQITQN